MGLGGWVRNGLQGLAGSSQGMGSTYRATQAQIANMASRLVDPRQRYAVLRMYYFQNALYESLSDAMYRSNIWTRATRPLRNPAFRIVEAHVQHLWPGDLPGALPIQTENAKIIPVIHKVWQYSNWANKKQIMARWLPMLGDVFVKVVRPDGGPRVWFELIDPAHVAAFTTDPRGNLTMLRLEVPQVRDDAAQTAYVHVEIWSKALQTFRRWEVVGGLGTTVPERELGVPLEEVPLARWGIDFVPVVHAKFIDVGEERGIGAYLLQLDKIDAVNADATRLAQMLYRHNQAVWAVHGAGNDPSGRPLPAVQITGATASSDGVQAADWGDNEIIHLPGLAQLTPLVPALNYEAHRLVNSDGLLDLQQDCPEIAYWRITQLGLADLSGRALKMMLAPFVKRVLEARGNAEDALARADAMALSIGAAAPALPGFINLGSFDQGDFEHVFEARDVLPVSDVERAEAEAGMADAAVKKLAAGWSQAAVMRDAGLSAAEIEVIARERAEQDSIPVDGP
jgi:hypothetical protein